ncbi:PQQ-binding-like beta-propeller repeat protein [Streptomyces longwoodensis]|uniref:caspase, EACC1-associated type n=1 Tax=Streptomyces longwoodensis TaxID=68231 RepID=UPI0037F15EC6
MSVPAPIEGNRGALLIGTGRYDHPDLVDLLSPAVDCAQLSEVLGDAEVGGFAVQALVDADLPDQTRAIEQFFGQAGPQDIRLLYLSCHGIVNERDGKLHFAVGATDPEWPAHSSISASFVHEQMAASHARSIVVVLDCCYSGRFLSGAKGGDAPTEFNKALTGRGRVVITAGTRTQRAYEGVHDGPAAPAPSRFTGPLIEGLRTGAADLDGDGLITVQELYAYVCGRLLEQGIRQNPLMGFELQNDIPLARVKPKPKPKRRRAHSSVQESPPVRPDLPWHIRAATGRTAGQPVLVDGLVVVAEKHRLHVIDTESRRRVTSVELRHAGRPAFHLGTAYFPDREHHLQAIDLHTGRTSHGRSPRLRVTAGTLGVCGDVLYAPGLDGQLYAVDLDSGKERHPRFPLDGLTALRAPEPAVGMALLLVDGDPQGVVAIDVATGVQTWRYKAEEPLTGDWAVTDQSVHVVEAAEGAPGRIVTLDPASGRTLWTHELPAGLAAAPTASGGLIAYGTVDHRLVVLAARTGDSPWGGRAPHRKTEGRLLTRPMLVNGTLYTADRTARITAWRTRDGRRLRTYDLHVCEDRHGSLVGADGVLYATDSRGDLHALPAR